MILYPVRSDRRTRGRSSGRPDAPRYSLRFGPRITPSFGRLLLLVILLAASGAVSPAETAPGSIAPRDLRPDLQGSSASGVTWESRLDGSSRTRAWSVETPIDPRIYRVVPGDLLNLGIWGENPLSIALGVTPEGEIVLPGVGPVSILGQTLRQAEQQTQESLARLYPNAKVTLRLLEPGRFRVSISGMVMQPGVYEATSADRLSMVIDAAGGIRPGGSRRRVRIHPPPDPLATRADLASLKSDALRAGSETSHASGETAGSPRVIDLLPWLLEGDLQANPTLTPGILIEIATQEETVRIWGPVNGRSDHTLPREGEPEFGNRPAEEPDLVFEWRPGDTLALLIAQAGGLSPLAEAVGTLHRAGETRAIDLGDDTQLAMPLEPADLVEIGQTMRWVFVVGSVDSPGRYPYYSGFTARDYVSLAGGESEHGRSSGWKLSLPDGSTPGAGDRATIRPGTTIRVPERRTRWITNVLSPLTTAAALVLSVVALANR